MSDALAYLLKARPEAMGHYFAFLKHCGTHLDPKTRALISVITKVDAQTERGFRQYLARALREGCTPMEVLDALLMAFPTLGLSKIVWAVDIILALRLPGFLPEALGAVAASPAVATAAANTAAATATAAAATVADAGQWHDVMASRGVKVGQTRRVDAAGRGLFVYRESARRWRVYDSRCPHQGTVIAEPALQGHRLTCPLHQWAFDVRSGECIAVGDRPLTLWPSKVVAGRLMARW